MGKTVRLFILIACMAFEAGAQAPGWEERSVILNLRGDTLRPDSLSLVPGSIKLFNPSGDSIESHHFQVHAGQGWIVLSEGFRLENPGVKQVRVVYRVFPYDFAEKTFHKDAGAVSFQQGETTDPFLYKTTGKKDDDLFALGSLSKSGSLSRGIMFGNNQDLSVNSSMDLQIAGKVTDKMEVRAAVSDDNIPIQPDGNTAALQDFDQVFIELSAPQSRLIAGDFPLSGPASPWMQFQKRTQGAGYNTWFAARDSQRVDITANAAVSKGKFARQVFNGQEGNQGPYRLRGAESEAFIMVLAGTERVYIDGQLMERGQENDYTIDYNAAEISFTARRMITKDIRIICEFQYSDRNYARSLLYTGASWKGKGGIGHLHFYSEQDSKNQPLQQDLSQEEKTLLASVGDRLEDAVVPRQDSVGYTDNEVRYAKIDSAGFTDIFVHSTDPSTAHYRLSFSYIGPGKGNYRLAKNAANGRVFEWVMPVQSQPQGDYEPVIKLVSPKAQRMLSAGWTKFFSRRTSLSLETGFSQNDINTFSETDKGNDNGLALSLRASRMVPETDSAGWKWGNHAFYEFQHRYFQPVERIREVEFNRIWNIDPGLVNFNQHFGGMGWQLYHGKTFRGKWESKALQLGAEYLGFQHAFSAGLHTQRWRMNTDNSYLISKGNISRTRFARYKTRVERHWRILKLGVVFEGEHNRFMKPGSDSLTFPAASWRSGEWYLANADTSALGFRLFYGRRIDELPTGSKFVHAFSADQTGFEVSRMSRPKHGYKIAVALRQLQVEDTSLTPLTDDRTLNIRAEHRLNLGNGLLRSTTFYESSSGLEIRKEFVYLEVPAGQGSFSWTDYNGNGIRELDEFEVAVFADQAKYIRVFTPTNAYIKVYSQQWSQSFYLQPAAIERQTENGLKTWLARFSNQMSYRVQRKTATPDPLALLDYFSEDTNLVSIQAGLRNSLAYNRNRGKVGADIQWLDAFNRTLLVNGPEWTRNRSRTIGLRLTLAKNFILRAEELEGSKTNHADFFPQRNFAIRIRESSAKLTWQSGSQSRISLTYLYGTKQNEEEPGNEHASRNEASIEGWLASSSKGSLMARFNYLVLTFDGVQNSPLGFEMLGGLRTGKNYTWTLSWQRNLAKNLQLDLQYQGRKPNGLKAVHTANAQIRAFF